MIIFVCGSFSATPKRLSGFIPDSRVISGYKGKGIRCTHGDVVVNWGNMVPVEVTDGVKVLNRNITNNKIHALEVFEKAGLPHSSLLYDGDRFPDGGVIVKPVSGHGGVGVVYCKTEEDAEKRLKEKPAHFACFYINKVAEFRVHVFGGEAVCWTRKKAEEGVDASKEVAWNADRGFAQVEIKNKLTKTILSNLSIDSMAALGYDFGAVDIVQDRYGLLYLLEVNTAPSIKADGRVDAYVSLIQAMAGRDA